MAKKTNSPADPQQEERRAAAVALALASRDRILGIARRNLLNQTEVLMRKCIGDNVIVKTIQHGPTGAVYQLKSVPYIPAKAKDQTFHRLEVTRITPYGNEDKPLPEEEINFREALDIFETILHIVQQPE